VFVKRHYRNCRSTKRQTSDEPCAVCQWREWFWATLRREAEAFTEQQRDEQILSQEYIAYAIGGNIREASLACDKKYLCAN
jgi:hypothetical protein